MMDLIVIENSNRHYLRDIGYVEGEEFTPTSLFGSFIECESE